MCEAVPVKETTMANYSRWDDIKKQRPAVGTETRTGIEPVGQLCAR